jgi:hypothetical protein
MLAAWVGIANGFLEQGGYPLVLGDAMIRPEKTLSVSFEGRKLKWLDDVSGHWVIDSTDKWTAQFKAQLAEDIGLCKGIADTKDDLAFLLGYREYREVPESSKIVDNYIEDWRRTLDLTDKWGREFGDALRYANGPDAIKYLGQAISALEKIYRAMVMYEAVEFRWQQTRGEDRHSVQLTIERLKEQIRGIKQGGKSGSAPSAPGGSGLGGSGGGRRGR